MPLVRYHHASTLLADLSPCHYYCAAAGSNSKKALEARPVTRHPSTSLAGRSPCHCFFVGWKASKSRSMTHHHIIICYAPARRLRGLGRRPCLDPFLLFGSHWGSTCPDCLNRWPFRNIVFIFLDFWNTRAFFLRRCTCTPR